MTPDHTYTPPPPRRPWWLIPGIIGASIAAVAVLVAAGLLFLNSRTIDVAGDITVTDAGGILPYAGTCKTSGGFADIAAGAQVVIKDSTGKVVATTTLAGGTGPTAGGTCTFGFHTSVPSGSDFYGVELGRRGVVQFTADQLADGVHLTLGG
jgi:hypothetical protein